MLNTTGNAQSPSMHKKVPIILVNKNMVRNKDKNSPLVAQCTITSNDSDSSTDARTAWWPVLSNGYEYATLPFVILQNICTQTNFICPFQIDQSQSLEMLISSSSHLCIGYNYFRIFISAFVIAFYAGIAIMSPRDCLSRKGVKSYTLGAYYFSPAFA